MATVQSLPTPEDIKLLIDPLDKTTNKSAGYGDSLHNP